MKKTVQIVTVPIDKNGFWNIGDIMKSPSGDRTWLINNTNFGETLCFWKPQQLLVLSDEPLQDKDFGKAVIFNPENCKGVLQVHGVCDEETIKNDKKVIAAYPHLPYTLPLSKETIQEWIDNGTPKECSVEMIEYEPETYSLEIDYQGNLILEFDKQPYEIDLDYPEEELTNKEAKEWCESIKQSYTPKEFLAALKTVSSGNRTKWAKDNKHLIVYTEESTIPTDEEIEEKARSFVKSGNYGDVDMTQSIMAESYQNGYKQALKDLGYDK